MNECPCATSESGDANVRRKANKLSEFSLEGDSARAWDEGVALHAGLLEPPLGSDRNFLYPLAEALRADLEAAYAELAPPGGAGAAFELTPAAVGRRALIAAGGGAKFSRGQLARLQGGAGYLGTFHDDEEAAKAVNAEIKKRGLEHCCRLNPVGPDGRVIPKDPNGKRSLGRVYHRRAPTPPPARPPAGGGQTPRADLAAVDTPTLSLIHI